MKPKRIALYLKAVILLPAYAFTTQPGTPLNVKNAVQARDTAIAYLNGITDNTLPEADWQQSTLYTTGIEDYAITSKLFAADNWLIEVYQGVAPLHLTVYEVTFFHTTDRAYWKGKIKADGTVTESESFRNLPADEGKALAEEYERRRQIPRPKAGGYGH